MMKVKLLRWTPMRLYFAAARKSHNSEERLDTKNNDIGTHDAALLKHLVQAGHDSVLEHIVYTFEIEGISRALLQELARHRHISMTVQSTRFVLKKLFRRLEGKRIGPKRLVQHFCVIPPFERKEEEEVFIKTVGSVLMKIWNLSDICNDYLKYFLPECFKTSLVLTVNARELDHIFQLRLSPYALWEFMELARQLLLKVYEVHPELWRLLAERGGYRTFLEDSGEMNM